MLGLGEPQRQLGVAREPERRGEEGLEQRREVSGDAADDRPSRLGDAVRECGIGVLVGQVEGRLDGERGEDEADECAQRDEAAEQPGVGDVEWARDDAGADGGG